MANRSAKRGKYIVNALLRAREVLKKLRDRLEFERMSERSSKRRKHMIAVAKRNVTRLARKCALSATVRMKKLGKGIRSKAMAELRVER